MTADKKMDGRAVYGAAQDAVESVLANLTGDNFATNVIVICHGTYMDLPDQTKKIFPQGVGQKLSPKIPQYFPVYIRFKNTAGTRTIQIVSDPMIDVAMPKIDAFKEKSLPVETGLATIFDTLRGKVPAAPLTVVKPKVATIQRR
jgi:formaldehyde-activating enzyme involved in methanogenesis